MACFCLNNKCGIFFLLITNLLINFILFIILGLSCYDILALNFFQKIYLILALFDWTFLTFFSIAKIILIIIGKFTYYYNNITVWKIINYPSYIIIMITLIYDAFSIGFNIGKVGLIFYFSIIVITSIIFIISSIFDYFVIKKLIDISEEKKERFPLNQELEMKNFKISNFG